MPSPPAGCLTFEQQKVKPTGHWARCNLPDINHTSVKETMTLEVLRQEVKREDRFFIY